VEDFGIQKQKGKDEAKWREKAKNGAHLPNEVSWVREKKKVKTNDATETGRKGVKEERMEYREEKHPGEYFEGVQSRRRE